MLNDHQQSSGICSVCKEEVRGGFDVYSREREDAFEIVIDSTPDRNFNVCDWCNDITCFRCSEDRDSGLCNPCYRLASVSISEESQQTN